MEKWVADAKRGGLGNPRQKKGLATRTGALPGWDAFLATRPSKWNGSPGSNAAKDASCREVWDDLSGLYRERFGAELRLVNYDHRDFAMLDVVRCVETGGRESTPRRPPRHRADAVTRTTPRAGGVGADTRTRI